MGDHAAGADRTCGAELVIVSYHRTEYHCDLQPGHPGLHYHEVLHAGRHDGGIAWSDALPITGAA